MLGGPVCRPLDAHTVTDAAIAATLIAEQDLSSRLTPVHCGPIAFRGDRIAYSGPAGSGCRG